MNASCPIWMIHAFIWDMTHSYGTCVAYSYVWIWLKTLLLLVQDIFTTGSWRASWYTSRIYMSHLKYTWAMSHLNKSCPCHIWISHVTHKWVLRMSRVCIWMSRVNESRQSCEWVTSHVNESCERATSHMNMSRLRINQSCLYINESRLHINESGHIWKMHSYIWMSHITHKSVTSTHKWVVWISRVMSRTDESHHIWISHVNEPCHTQMNHVKYKWVMWMIHVYRTLQKSCHVWMSHIRVTYEWVTSHMNQSCHIWISNMKKACLQGASKELAHSAHKTRQQISHQSSFDEGSWDMLQLATGPLQVCCSVL